jgi:diacylglycerol kinase (ATP)
MAREFSSDVERSFMATARHGESQLWVLGNRRARRCRAFQLGCRLESWFAERGCPALFFWPNSREELRDLAAKAAAAGQRRLVVLGGDGTLLDVANQIQGQPIEVGLVPTGDANDVAAALGLPQDPLAAAELLLEWNARPIDLIRVRTADGQERVFVGAGGAGLDAEAARLAAGEFRWLPGIWRYLAGALVAFSGYKRFEVSLEFEERTWHGSVFFVAIANTPAYGGGIRIAPEARPEDGWLDVAVAEDLNWRQVLRALPSLARAGNTSGLNLRRYRARRVRIETISPIPFHGDGEPLGATPLDAEVLPGALRVVCPSQRV